MKLEIEKRWLLKPDEIGVGLLTNPTLIKQYYLEYSPEYQVRLRYEEDIRSNMKSCTLTEKRTVKSHSEALVREETDINLSFTLSNKLISEAINVVKKLRYHITQKIIIDYFIHSRLYILEIEYVSELDIKIPDYLVHLIYKDVTNDPNYSNFKLATEVMKGEQVP